jgi:hypothetical protein
MNDIRTAKNRARRMRMQAPSDTGTQAFLAQADQLVVSTVCAHLDPRSLRATARTLRSFRQARDLGAAAQGRQEDWR